MGDDELNFTEEEAREWADDPRNQAQDWGASERLFALSAALVVAVMVAIWLVSSAVQPQPPGFLLPLL